LFTPVSLAPGLRLQIRNPVATSQEKIGIIFCFSAQKNLDENRFSDGPNFTQEAIRWRVSDSLGEASRRAPKTGVFEKFWDRNEFENVRQAIDLPEIPT
jgi:hypothetical protein